jgi:glucan-binding YG repeat protein
MQKINLKRARDAEEAEAFAVAKKAKVEEKKGEYKRNFHPRLQAIVDKLEVKKSAPSAPMDPAQRTALVNNVLAKLKERKDREDAEAKRQKLPITDKQKQDKKDEMKKLEAKQQQPSPSPSPSPAPVDKSGSNSLSSAQSSNAPVIAVNKPDGAKS